MGRLLVRPSGTEDLVRIMAEGENVDVVNAVIDDISADLHTIAVRALAA